MQYESTANRNLILLKSGTIDDTVDETPFYLPEAEGIIISSDKISINASFTNGVIEITFIPTKYNTLLSTNVSSKDLAGSICGLANEQAQLDILLPIYETDRLLSQVIAHEALSHHVTSGKQATAVLAAVSASHIQAIEHMNSLINTEASLRGAVCYIFTSTNYTFNEASDGSGTVVITLDTEQANQAWVGEPNELYDVTSLTYADVAHCVDKMNAPYTDEFLNDTFDRLVQAIKEVNEYANS